MIKRNFGLKLAAAAITGIMTMSLVACGGGSEGSGSSSASSSASGSTSEASANGETSDSKYKFYLVDPYVGYPYWDDVWQGCEAAAEAYGVEVVRVGPTTVNYDEQIKYFETAIADKADGIFTSALAPDTFASVINKSMSEGIPTVLIDSDAPDTDRIAYCGTSNYDAGYKAGEALKEAMGGKGTCGIMVGVVDSDNQIQRREGFEAAIKDSDIEVVDIEESQNDRTTGVSKASAMFLAYPDIDCAVGLSGDDGIALATAAEEQGISDKITIIGWDDQEDTINLINSGEIYGTVVQNTFAMGWDGVMYCYMAKEGLIENKKLDEDVIDTGVVVVTKDNVDDYKTDMTVEDLVNNKTVSKSE